MNPESKIVCRKYRLNNGDTYYNIHLWIDEKQNYRLDIYCKYLGRVTKYKTDWSNKSILICNSIVRDIYNVGDTVLDQLLLYLTFEYKWMISELDRDEIVIDKPLRSMTMYDSEEKNGVINLKYRDRFLSEVDNIYPYYEYWIYYLNNQHIYITLFRFDHSNSQTVEEIRYNKVDIIEFLTTYQFSIDPEIMKFIRPKIIEKGIEYYYLIIFKKLQNSLNNVLENHSYWSDSLFKLISDYCICKFDLSKN